MFQNHNAHSRKVNTTTMISIVLIKANITLTITTTVKLCYDNMALGTIAITSIIIVIVKTASISLLLSSSSFPCKASKDPHGFCNRRPPLLLRTCDVKSVWDAKWSLSIWPHSMEQTANPKYAHCPGCPSPSRKTESVWSKKNQQKWTWRKSNYCSMKNINVILAFLSLQEQHSRLICIPTALRMLKMFPSEDNITSNTKSKFQMQWDMNGYAKKLLPSSW